MNRNGKDQLAQFGWIAPLLISSGIYLATTCRTVYIGDSGEFALVFKTLGIAHPPGYPLFALVGHVWISLWGFLRPALSANLLGALLAAAIIPALYFIIDGRRRPILAGGLALIWAFSRASWSETSGVEVYGLNLTFIAVLSALALSENPRKWFLIAYFLGLALAHHLSAAAVLPALIFIFFSQKIAHRWRQFPIYMLLFLSGISIYLYLPIRSSLFPIADWSHPADLGLFFKHITGAQYQYALSFSLENLQNGLALLPSLVVKNWSWLGLALAMAGLALGFLYDRNKMIFALLLLITNGIIVSFYRIPDIDSYYLPGLLACWTLMSITILWLWNRLHKSAAQYALTAGVCLAALMMLILNYGKLDQSKNRLAEMYGRLILDAAKAGTVFTKDDNASFASLYLRYAENYQPKVEVFDQASRLQALLDQASQLAGGKVYDYKTAREVYFQKAAGLKFLAKCHFPYDAEWYGVRDTLYSQGILYATRRPAKKAGLPPLDEGKATEDYKARQMLVNLELCHAEEALLQEPADSAEAMGTFARALETMEGEPRGALLNELGIAFRHFGQEDLALQAYNRALQAARLSREERRKVVFNISNIYKDRGNRLAAAGDYPGAVQAFEKALEYDPGNMKVIYNVGLIYIQYLHNPQKGVPYLRQYLAGNPGDEKVKELIETHQ